MRSNKHLFCKKLVWNLKILHVRKHCNIIQTFSCEINLINSYNFECKRLMACISVYIEDANNVGYVIEYIRVCFQAESVYYWVVLSNEYNPDFRGKYFTYHSQTLEVNIWLCLFSFNMFSFVVVAMYLITWSPESFWWYIKPAKILHISLFHRVINDNILYLCMVVFRTTFMVMKPVCLGFKCEFIHGSLLSWSFFSSQYLHVVFRYFFRVLGILWRKIRRNIIKSRT